MIGGAVSDLWENLPDKDGNIPPEAEAWLNMSWYKKFYYCIADEYGMAMFIFYICWLILAIGTLGIGVLAIIGLMIRRIG